MIIDPALGSAIIAAPRRLSVVLKDLESGLGPRIALGDLVCGLRDRSFAALMVLFAMPNILFFVPGSSAITGLPLMMLALQLVAGRSTAWLPRAMSERFVDRARFGRIVRFSLPWVERIERLARPRFWPASTAGVDRLIGVACFVMALLLFLPIPFANGVPALVIIALGLALSERDGLWLIVGLLASVFAVVFVAAIVGGGAFALARIL